MHLLATRPGAISDGSEAVDLGQTPGDIVFLSAADSEIACLAAARNRIAEMDPRFPSLRLASLMRLQHPLSVDLYVDRVVATARLVVVRCLGGRGYWPYGVEQIGAVCGERSIPVVFLPGDDQPDAEFAQMSNVTAEDYHRLWQYLVHGGLDNAIEFLRCAARLAGHDGAWKEPRPLVRTGLYWPGRDQTDLDAVRGAWSDDRQAVAAILFYRALIQAGHLAAIDALIAALQQHGLNPLPVFTVTLKDPIAQATIERLFAATSPEIVLNATGFAVSAPGGDAVVTPFAGADCPVLQVILAGSEEAAWRASTQGLAAKDIAMNVALPEVDGRIITRAIAFKQRRQHDALTESDIVGQVPVADRVAFVAELAARWVRLKRTQPGDRRIALLLANYPNRDGRIGNGVGLDTPASVCRIITALAAAGYTVQDAPTDGNALVRRLTSGPTNDLAALADRRVEITMPLAVYRDLFSRLPASVQTEVEGRWGSPEQDPCFLPDGNGGHLALAIFLCGHLAIGLQPARGYNIDPQSSYHAPDLPPPHSYLAFYWWLRERFAADAVVHIGKHGNLEWLPGKAIALSDACYPELALGPMPHLYPFIVNDPGEGAQAKRRAQAVIVDHLTPPLTRAESYGALRDLECLVDEYFEAAGVDPRRLKVLSEEIVSLTRASGVAEDCGIRDDDPREEALTKLDRYLCELKEMQIRDGLHVFGQSPAGRLLDDLLVALVRVPRGRGQGGDASLLRAVADDLGLGFDPLACDFAEPWTGPRPEALCDPAQPWRTAGDTVERIEALALDLVTGRWQPPPTWNGTRAVLDVIQSHLRPALLASAACEIEGLIKGLDGRFVPPGPSGAPTRGRPEVLPTGRNFYSVDTRTVPTPAAWTLGWQSASLLLDRYAQEHGDWPKRLALTAWGTSNMRTGGDDIAQALALLGVRPNWETASRRVTGFEILPLSILDRPRVDVTLRISGFFRDAFPGLIDLFDSAVRAVAALDEPAEQNPLAAAVEREQADLVATGIVEDDARLFAGCRIFGAKPGAYGAGLQALIDEKGWQTDADLARAYVAWGGYAYAAGVAGRAAHEVFERRLGSVEVVVQNQDNREHDILDSDDYYQFEGGITAAVRVLSGQQPTVLHADHARPEHPRIRTLEEEVGRVVRARVVNPKWIEGVMRHAYKGGFEMAATVDYLFAFAATARCVKDHHFDAVFRAYIDDETVREFLAENNPAALREMSERLIEAQERGLWRPGVNSAYTTLASLTGKPAA
jgi:cobaltochelatase CobN